MTNSMIKTITVLLLLMTPVVAMAQEEPQQETRIAVPVHEITGSSDILGVETRVIDEPVPFRAKEMTHLVYEIQVANFDRETVRLKELEVFSAGDEATLLKALGPQELKGAWADFGRSAENADMFSLRPGSFTVIYMWHELQPGEPLPEALLHRFNFIVLDENSERQVSVLMDPVSVEEATPVVIGLPLRGGPWISWDGQLNHSRHRRAMVPKGGKLALNSRFAIDWFLVQGETVETAGPDPMNTHGAEVLAVADGEVVAVIDGIPDNPLSEPEARAVPINWETITGNLVILDIGNGRFVYYAHLLVGSITVKPGDRVQRGDVIGLIGNSGNSAGPHLHFEINDSDVIGRGRGLPFVFKEFDLLAEIGFGPEWQEQSRYTEPEEQLRRSELPPASWRHRCVDRQ